LAVKEEYDVLRLIEHNQICYISSEYVKGDPLARWIKYHPCVEKDELFRVISDIAKQLSQIHRCRGNPCYRYVNPYSIIVSEERQISFLDVNAESNNDQLRIMQRRTVREHFLPPEEPYYQKASIELDIYGFGRTLQYLLSETEVEPPLCRREEVKFQKIISRSLNRQSKKIFQNVSEIQRMIPKYRQLKKQTNGEKRLTQAVMTGTMIAVLAGAAIGGGVVVVKSINTAAEQAKQEGDKQEEKEQTKQTSNRQEERNVSGSDGITDGKKEERLNMELGTVYFLELKNYEKSGEYFRSVKDNPLAEHMAVIAECFAGDHAQAGRLRQILSEAEIILEEQDEEWIGEKQSYYRCLLKGYTILGESGDFRNLLRLGKRCLQDSSKEETAETLGYMAFACEGLGEMEEAVHMYEEQLKQEEDGMVREEIYKKAADILIRLGESGQAQEMLRTGIGEINDSAELRTAYAAALLGDSDMERQLCIQSIQEQLRELPELGDVEEFKKLMRQYGINLEGDKTWQER